MNIHMKNLRYILRHKWFVFVECCRLGIPWLGIIHDLSKFYPVEWTAYAHSFFGGDYPRLVEAARYGGPTKESVKTGCGLAWLHHQKNNKHHWQYWVLTYDSDSPQRYCLPMPDKYRREMLADWRGAGLAQGNPDTKAWYLEHKDKIQLHPDTRRWIETELA